MKKGTLLILEDEIELRTNYVDYLEPYCDEILVASDGKTGLELVKRGNIDAVITDISMPVMDGLQFLAELRIACIQTPVIVVTAFADLKSAQEALRLDATDLLEKPCKFETLKEITLKALEFGLALREMEVEIDKMFESVKESPDKIARLKKIQRVTRGMKLGFTTYHKK